MGFWDKLETWAKKIEESEKKFEEKANAFLDKTFPDEEEEKEVYSSQQLLALMNNNFDRLFRDRLLDKVKELAPQTTHIDSDLLTRITCRTIEEKQTNLRTDVGQPQYYITIKGTLHGEDDYNLSTGYFKFDVYITIDSTTTYVVNNIKIDK